MVGQTSCQDLRMVCNEIATRAALPDLLRPLPSFVKTSLLISLPHAPADSFPTTTPAEGPGPAANYVATITRLCRMTRSPMR